MNQWVIPIIIVIFLILGGILFFTQSKGKEAPELPSAESGSFQPISLTPGQGQTATDSVQGQQDQIQPAQELKASYSATIKTTKGDIKVTLRADAAPNTVINFIQKAQGNFYNGLTFHRVEDWVVQGGDPKGNGTGGGQMQTELNVLPFKAGSLGVARGGNIKISNDSQFFITKTDASWLDQQYTNFGQVTEGMDVVSQMSIGDKILGITVEGIN